MYIDTHCTYREEYQPKHVYIFTGKCIVTKKLYTVTIPAVGLFNLRHSAYTQDALNMLPPGYREFVMTGISPEGCEQMFGGDEE